MYKNVKNIKNINKSALTYSNKEIRQFYLVAIVIWGYCVPKVFKPLDYRFILFSTRDLCRCRSLVDKKKTIENLEQTLFRGPSSAVLCCVLCVVVVQASDSLRQAALLALGFKRQQVRARAYDQHVHVFLIPVLLRIFAIHFTMLEFFSPLR